MRLGEILAAKWDHLDWEKQRYSVRETLSGKRVFGQPKITDSAALAPLSTFVMDTLDQHLKRQAEKLEL